MLYSKEIQNLHEIIEEYLEYGNFNNTLECFQHEVKTKWITNKLNFKENNLLGKNYIPKLLKLSKGLIIKTDKEEILEKKCEELREDILNTKIAFRHLYSTNIKILESFSLEKNKWNNDQKKLLERSKNWLGKFYNLVFIENKKLISKLPSEGRIKQWNKNLKLNINNINKNKEIEDIMRDIRNTAWSLETNNQKNFLNRIIKNDIFYLNNDGNKEDSLLNYLLFKSNVSIKINTIAILNYISYLKKGSELIIINKNHLDYFYKLFIDEEIGNCCSRFLITMLSRLCILDEISLYFYSKNIWVLILNKIDLTYTQNIHRYYINALSILAYNILKNKSIFNKLIISSDKTKEILKLLIKILNKKIEINCFINLLKIIKLFYIKSFKDILEELIIEENIKQISSNVQIFYDKKIYSNFYLDKINQLLIELLNPLEMIKNNTKETVITFPKQFLFESFTDEIN